MAKDKDKKKKKKESSNKPSSSVLDKIRPTSEVHEFVTCLFYGRSGTGKTSIAGTFPGPILFLDLREQGTDSVSDVEGADVISIETWDDLEDVYWFLSDTKEGRKYKTVVVDTVSQMQDMAMAKVKEDARKEQMTQQMWGNISGMLKQWLGYFRDLDRHIVFLAQDKEVEAEDQSDAEQIMPSVGPLVMPSVAKILCAAVMVIGNTYIFETRKQVEGKMKKKMEYRLRLGPHPIYTTKFRSPKGVEIPEFIKDPTFEALINVMRGQHTKKPKKGEK